MIADAKNILKFFKITLTDRVICDIITAIDRVLPDIVVERNVQK